MNTKSIVVDSALAVRSWGVDNQGSHVAPRDPEAATQNERRYALGPSKMTKRCNFMGNLASIGMCFLAVTSLPACGADPQEESSLDSSDQAIEGGTIDNADRAVGYVFVPLVPPFNQMCTGTLITPQVVLTAAHCLFDNSANSVTVQSFSTGPGLAAPPNPDPTTVNTFNVHPVDAQVPNPKYVPTLNDACGNADDVALLHLSNPVPPQEALPVAFAHTQPAQVGQVYAAVGYGHHQPPNTTGTRGRKRRAAVRVTQVANGIITVQWVTGLPDFGDSGGPLFCLDHVIAGVDHCKGTDPSGIPWASYINVVDQAKWIDDTIKQNNW